MGLMWAGLWGFMGLMNQTVVTLSITNLDLYNIHNIVSKQCKTRLNNRKKIIRN